MKMTSEVLWQKGKDVDKKIVTEAILRHVEHNDSRQYNKIVDELKSLKVTDEVLANVLSYLSDIVAIIGKRKCNDLVKAVLHLDWTHKDAIVIAQYKCFLLHFVAAHANQIQTVLQAIVKNCFANRDASLDDQASNHVHEVIKGISTLVPMTTTHLIPVLKECFPYYRHNAKIQEIYVKNLLTITNYMPQRRREILEQIVAQLVTLDSCTPNPRSEKIVQKIPLTVEAKVPSLFGEPKETLDVLMEVVFSYMQKICFHQDELVWDSTKKLYQDILDIFNNIILPTHACAHVQFLLFYLCSLNASLCENTIDHLWKKTQNPNVPTILRQMSVLYLSGFLARAKFVSINLVVSCLNALCSWIDKYIDSYDKSQIFVDTKLHGVFYGVCQAVFYIIIYRHLELLALPKGYSYFTTLSLDKMITCSLNPLHVCHPVVVRKFAAIMSVYQVAYCQTVLQKNQRLDLPTAEVSFGEMSNPLESFFPFESYGLERSKHFISPLYRDFERTLSETNHPDCEEDDFLHGDIDMVELGFSAGESILSSSPGFT